MIDQGSRLPLLLLPLDREGLLGTALTHPSFAAESPVRVEDNQRLEYLGDAVIGLLAAEWLWGAHGEWDEGVLTRARSRLTNEGTLAGVARRAGLGGQLRLGKGEEREGGREKAGILADALEAVFGAIWLEAGAAVARDIFREWFAEELAGVTGGALGDNPKGELQERCQAAGKPIPVYGSVGCEGPLHAPFFRVAVFVGGERLAVGEGGSKHAAEVDAARRALVRFS